MVAHWLVFCAAACAPALLRVWLVFGLWIQLRWTLRDWWTGWVAMFCVLRWRSACWFHCAVDYALCVWHAFGTFCSAGFFVLCAFLPFLPLLCDFVVVCRLPCGCSRRAARGRRVLHARCWSRHGLLVTPSAPPCLSVPPCYPLIDCTLVRDCSALLRFGTLSRCLPHLPSSVMC